MATVTRLNGFGGPIELSVVGDVISGKTTLAAGQTIAFVPLIVKAGTKPGAYDFRVRGASLMPAEEIVRFGTLTDSVKTALGGMPNPPPEMLNALAVAVIEKPALALKLTADFASIEKGKAGKILVETTRGDGADADIAIAPLFTPPNVTPAAKPIAKGQTKGEIGVTLAPAAALGPTLLTFRATTKIGGRDTRSFLRRW